MNIRNSTAVKHRHNWGCVESGLIRCECDVNDRRGSWITVESITHTVDCGDIKTSLENVSLRVDYSSFLNFGLSYWTYALILRDLAVFYVYKF